MRGACGAGLAWRLRDHAITPSLGRTIASSALRAACGSAYNRAVLFRSYRLRLPLALLLALTQLLLPMAAYAMMGGKGALVQDICSADGKRMVLVDGEIQPATLGDDSEHGAHCALCMAPHGALPAPAWAVPVSDPVAQLITVGASHYQPRALKLGPPPRGPPASLQGSAA
jgi:hypothetical protein